MSLETLGKVFWVLIGIALCVFIWLSRAHAERVVQLPVLYPSTCDGAMYQIHYQDYLQLIAWDQENQHVFEQYCGDC